MRVPRIMDNNAHANGDKQNAPRDRRTEAGNSQGSENVQICMARPATARAASLMASLSPG
jgi:hypothetical protein